MSNEEELQEEEGDTSLSPSLADAQSLVDARVPEALRSRYDFFSYKNAVVILAETHPTEWAELLDALDKFSITKEMITEGGGNESRIPKAISACLRPFNWHETVIRGDLHVKLIWREVVRITKSGKPVTAERDSTLVREGFLDGHKIDYVKNKVAFDLEWNSKDQTFDRDLYAFNAFYQAGAIDAAVLLTRSAELNEVFSDLGIAGKYGASTTWMGKLLYRLNAGRNGGCPVLAIGIRPGCVADWP
ncbi:restriction endonuclease BglII [Hoeflea halophila]|uniref:Restriction endonuclease BglII n=1 Tax=Hoeflea halophila TaxID=714899 RepID=A0A286HLZ5_9HYPH|nr:BglII/BstYI family type II restriction endonuclease [Hoeflea halophila]SOE08506.1 restriction endonuclease BglII [Hoeflea halophila]